MKSNEFGELFQDCDGISGDFPADRYEFNNVNTPLVIAFAVAVGGFWAIAISKAVAVRRSPVSVGPQTIVGEIGEARRDDLVFVHGELWRARPRDGSPLRPGQRIRVAGVGADLSLDVEHVADE